MCCYIIIVYYGKLENYNLFIYIIVYYAYGKLENYN